MSQFYCSEDHVWFSEFAGSVCPKCYRPALGMVATVRYRDIIRVRLENNVARSVVKHGTWDNFGLGRMLWILAGELYEVAAAVVRRDLHGPHGVAAELCDVATVCVKAIERLQRVKP